MKRTVSLVSKSVGTLTHATSVPSVASFENVSISCGIFVPIASVKKMSLPLLCTFALFRSVLLDMLTSTGKSVWSELLMTFVLFMVMALRNWNDRSNHGGGAIEVAETVPSDTATDSVSERSTSVPIGLVPSDAATDSVSVRLTLIVLETVPSSTATDSISVRVSPETNSCTPTLINVDGVFSLLYLVIIQSVERATSDIRTSSIIPMKNLLSPSARRPISAGSVVASMFPLLGVLPSSTPST